MNYSEERNRRGLGRFLLRHLRIKILCVFYFRCSPSLVSVLVLCDGDELLALGQGGQRSLDGEDAIFAQRRLDALGVGSLGQHELAVVLSVHGLAVGLLLVLGVDLKQTHVT